MFFLKKIERKSLFVGMEILKPNLFFDKNLGLFCELQLDF